MCPDRESWKEALGVDGAIKLIWSFQLLDGEHKGAMISTVTTLSEKAEWRLARLVRACGKPVEGMDFDPDSVANSHLRIVIRESEYQGQPITEVADFLPENGD